MLNPLYQVIETQSKLETLVSQLGREKAIAVDLEADSMYHYREKVCLLQIASSKLTAVIDPLPIQDLSPLGPIFSNPKIRKIFHGADYDVRSLYRDFGIEIVNLFDTQIACRFIGLTETGLEAVIHHFFNITLNKKYQKKDWSERPLPEDMIEYAATDVKYLIPLAKLLEKELKKTGRFDWVQEECDLLSKVRTPPANHEPLYLKFKSAGQLKPRSLAILEALLQVRKTIAEKKDKPVFKVLGNETILNLVNAKPISMKQLVKTQLLSRAQINMYGDELIQAVISAMAIPESELPIYPKKPIPKMTQAVAERVKIIKSWRDQKAEELNMDFSLICNKGLITAIATKNPKSVRELGEIGEMRAWQRKEFGKEIVEVIKSR